MRKPNPDLRQQIMEAALALVIEAGQEGIAMRDLAVRCGITATTIYYYWKDKDSLLEALKFHCLSGMDAAIARRIETAQKETNNTLLILRHGLEAFRDWVLANPGIALLVMSGFKPDTQAEAEKLDQYYISSRRAEALVAAAVAKGLCSSCNPRMDSSLCIAALWGALESVLLKRSWPDFWERGQELSDRTIDMCLHWLQSGGKSTKEVL